MLVEGHDVEKTGISVDEMVCKKAHRPHGHLSKRQYWKNSWRSSSTLSRLVLRWTSLDRRMCLVRIVYIMLQGIRRMFKSSNSSLIITMETSKTSSIQDEEDEKIDYIVTMILYHRGHCVIMRKYGEERDLLYDYCDYPNNMNDETDYKDYAAKNTLILMVIIIDKLKNPNI